MTDNARFWSKTPWRPLPDIVHAVCIRHFDAAGSDDLTLQLGDEVYITEVNGKESQWCRGWLLAHPSLVSGLTAPPGQNLRPRAYAGIFPRCCVSVREVLADPDKARTTRRAKGHSRNASAPSHSIVNGDLAQTPTRTNLQERPRDYRSLRSSPPAGTLASSSSRTSPVSDGKPSPPARQDSPLAPLVPRDVSPRAPGAPKEPAPLPALRIGGGGRNDGEPLVDDISSTLREWHSSRLHNMALRREYKKMDELSALVDRLSDARRQLAHNLLTDQEKRKLREQVVWDLVKGNKMVDGEVIVRDATQNGRTLTARDSLAEMADLQTVMSLRDRPVANAAKEAHLSHLLMLIRAVPQFLRDPALLNISLYSVSSSGKPKPVSETFAVELAIEEGTGRVDIADNFSATLFNELNKADVGGGDQSDSRLYLVCRLVHDEPMHKARVAPPSSSSSPVPPSGGFDDLSGRGRLSFARSRSRRGSETNDKTRPTTNSSKRSASVNRSDTVSTAASSERPETAKTARRVAGWCAVSVSSLILDRAAERLTMSFWVPAGPNDGPVKSPPADQDGWNDIIKSLARSPSGDFCKASSVGTFSLDIAAFAHDSVDLLIKERPALLRDIHRTPSLSLNGAAQQSRSDIYLTIREPVLPLRAKCFHPQTGSVPLNSDTDLLNLQVTLEVRTNDGQRIDDAIHPTANRRPHTAYRSTAIERGEAWNQTLRLSISPRDLHNAHVIMSVADGANFPFALAWIPLWDSLDGFPADGPHTLALWEYCPYTANLIEGKGAYQSLPSRVDELKDQQGPQMASMVIETHLSSTSATQNADVLALSNLDSISLEATAALLERFQAIADEEIAKFFCPILLSLEYVLDQCTEMDPRSMSQKDFETNKNISEAAVKCLAHAVRLIRDRRYPHLHELLDDYVLRRKPSPEARISILRSLRSLVSKPFDARGGRELRACLKVTDVLLKFALRRSAPNVDEEMPSNRLPQEITEFFEDVVVLLSNTSHLALPSQVIIVQSLHTWLPEVMPLCSGQDVLQITAAAADTCVRNHSPLWLHRLSMIYSVSRLEPFQQDPLRSAFIDATESWLLPVWPSDPDIDETSISALRLCVTIVKDQQAFMTYAQSQRCIQRLFSAFFLIHKSASTSTLQAVSPKIKPTASKRKALSPLFPTSHPFRSVSTTAELVPSEILLELSAVLGSFFQMGSQTSSLILGIPPQGSEQTDDPSEADLAEALTVIRALQSSAAFPPSWLSLCVSMSQCTVGMLAWILSHLSAALPNESDDDGEAALDFDSTLWTLWFESVITLVTSDTVRMEEYSEQKRRAIWTIGGDIRESAAGLLKRAWDSLGWPNDEETERIYGISRMGGYQVQFTSQLIPSIVTLGLSLHLGLRTTAVEILKTMIIGEWELNGNLDEVRGALANALDNAFRDDKFEPGQARILLDTLRQRLTFLNGAGNNDLHLTITTMLAEIQVLVERLIEIRDCAANPNLQLELRVNLLSHLRMINDEASYLRLIHDVAEAQVGNQSYSSAALAIQLHLEFLLQKATPDSDVQLAREYEDLQLPVQTFFQRRQMLYSAMAKYFRMGCCWGRVLSTLESQRTELLEAYETTNLAPLLQQQAETYQKLTNGKGLLMPRYFKVAFSNHQGFSPTVMGRSFIFEAPAEDDTTRFSKRLKQAYPTATIIHSGVTSATTSNDAPKLHVISVNVNREQLHPVNQRAGVSPFFRLHRLSTEPSTFSNSTRQQKPGLSVAEQTVAKTIYMTAEPFPTLLGRSEIINEQAVILSPVQAAIDRVHRKTIDLAEILINTDLNDASDNDKLVQAIRSSVDPDCVDSIAGYHDLILDDEFLLASSNTSLSRQSRPDGSRGVSHVHSNSAVSSRSRLDDDKEEHKAHLNVLTVSLQDHARLLEQALATGFSQRLAVKTKLREDLEKTFEPELYGLYPDGKWQSRSSAWTDARPATRPPPPQRGESLFADLAPATGVIPVMFEMSGGGAASPSQGAALGRADSTTPYSVPGQPAIGSQLGHRKLHSSSSAIDGGAAGAQTSRPDSRLGSRRGLGAAESDTETETGRNMGSRRRLSFLARGWDKSDFEKKN